MTTDLNEDGSVLAVDDLRVEFTRGGGLLRRRHVTKAVDGVALRLRPGQTLGLVGESGSGKTTLVRTVFGLNRPTAGTIDVLGCRLTDASAADRRRTMQRIQLVFQDPYSSLDPRWTVRDILAEPLRLAGRRDPERVVEVLHDVGMEDDALDRRPSAFSGGQRQRIGIARALVMRPEILVLDEPVSALDVSVQAQVVNLLKDLQRERGLSYLFIAHDLSVVRYISDHLAVMRRGEIVEHGTCDEIFGDPRHPYTKELLGSVPNADPWARPGAPARRRLLPA
ncbi:ATP-binding cassette domain-containing protein [Cellulomonas sp. NPDC057328]|uniref:ATP-binding cassette domain-containing protein n=1 Tax=Cellulomonas sp. NPDC057328 TaxID=3346101 RepID=UPI00363C00A2